MEILPSPFIPNDVLMSGDWTPTISVGPLCASEPAESRVALIGTTLLPSMIDSPPQHHPRPADALYGVEQVTCHRDLGVSPMFLGEGTSLR